MRLIIIVLLLPGQIFCQHADTCDDAVTAYLHKEYAKSIELHKQCQPYISNKSLPDFYFQIGLCFQKLEQYDSSIFYTNKALELKKDDIEFMEKIAYLYLKKGYIEKALKEMKGISFREIIPAYLISEFLEQSTGKMPEKEKYYRNYGLKHYPKEIFFYECEANFLLNSQKYVDAEKWALKIIKEDSTDYYAYGILGQVQYHLDKDSIAYINLTIACNHKYPDPYFFYYRAITGLLLSFTDYNQVVEDANKALEYKYYEPNLCYYVRGCAFNKMGKYQDAISDFLKDLKYEATHYYAYYGLAESYYFMGDKEDALAYLNKYIELQGEKGSADLKNKIMNLP